MRVDRTLPVLLALVPLACGGAGFSPATRPALPPDVTVDFEERRYTVSGTDARTLRDQMRARGPGSYGRVDWHLHTTWRYGTVDRSVASATDARSRQCEMKELDIRLTITMTLPDWADRASAPPALVERWDAFAAALRAHEEGHRNIALRAASEVSRRLGRLRVHACPYMNAAARELQSSIIDEWNERSRTYDQETRAGRTQGAVWPPRPPGG